MRGTRPGIVRAAGAAALLVLGTGGCEGAAPAIRVRAPFRAGTSIAVAPVLNFSGQFDLDPVQAADLLASELTQYAGITVLPVSRVVAALAAEGRQQVESPSHAVRTAEAVGADAILVAGITEYDAYAPCVGLVLQLYFVPEPAYPALDARTASREAAPVALNRMADSSVPIGQMQKVYNATHDDVVDAVRTYALPRLEGDSPYGWREYLKVQTKYLRFCWYDAIGRLMESTGGARRMSASLAASGTMERME